MPIKCGYPAEQGSERVLAVPRRARAYREAPALLLEIGGSEMVEDVHYVAFSPTHAQMTKHILATRSVDVQSRPKLGRLQCHTSPIVGHRCEDVQAVPIHHRRRSELSDFNDVVDVGIEKDSLREIMRQRADWGDHGRVI
ncbi:hypothetical protein DFH09DRAFT_1285647 [Mycena vulgaris]|nr:hypothetical protein DFH09DRAFT_1285647 [Mycena vulgaris]